MKGFKYIIYIALFIFVCHYFIFTQPGAYAGENLGDSLDCTDVSVDYLEDSSLTRKERLRLMDKAFFQSLNKFELCQEANRLAVAKAAAAAGVKGSNGSTGSNGFNGGNVGEQGGDSGKTAEDTGTMSGVESVASRTMSGTEPPREDFPADKAMDSAALQDSQAMTEAGSKTDGNMKRETGKRPEDIPSAQNDDVLAAQIRYAAENETDPVKSKQLWNEYRKYKGLATK